MCKECSSHIAIIHRLYQSYRTIFSECGTNFVYYNSFNEHTRKGYTCCEHLHDLTWTEQLRRKTYNIAAYRTTTSFKFGWEWTKKVSKKISNSTQVEEAGESGHICNYEQNGRWCENLVVAEKLIKIGVINNPLKSHCWSNFRSKSISRQTGPATTLKYRFQNLFRIFLSLLWKISFPVLDSDMTNKK